MTTADAIALIGGNQSDLAEALGISRQAISAWAGQVPYLRELHILEVVRRREEARLREAGE